MVRSIRKNISLQNDFNMSFLDHFFLQVSHGSSIRKSIKERKIEQSVFI